MREPKVKNQEPGKKCHFEPKREIFTKQHSELYVAEVLGGEGFSRWK